MDSKRELVCISCPVGCRLTVSRNPNGDVAVKGNNCARGGVYGRDEFTLPRRTVTTSVWVEKGHMPLLSVRTASPIPKIKINDALKALEHVRVTAPVKLGDVVLADVAGTGVDVVATRAIRVQ